MVTSTAVVPTTVLTTYQEQASSAHTLTNNNNNNNIGKEWRYGWGDYGVSGDGGGGGGGGAGVKSGWIAANERSLAGPHTRIPTTLQNFYDPKIRDVIQTMTGYPQPPWQRVPKVDV